MGHDTTRLNDESDEAVEARRRRETRAEIQEVKADLGALVVEHPGVALATAVGAGYVLGGGLFTSLTSRLLRLAFRVGVQFVVLPVLEQELATLVSKPPAGGSDKARAPH
jgi:hypothetical protein